MKSRGKAATQVANSNYLSGGIGMNVDCAF